MKTTTHFFLGYLIALFTVPTGNVPALWIWGLQLFPLFDVGLKRVFRFEPLHTVYGFVAVSVLLWALTPWWWLGSLSYALHLLVDLLVPSGVALLAPKNTKRYAFVVPYADRATLIVSLIGIAFMVWRLSS